MAGVFPPLRGSSPVQAEDPTTLLQVDSRRRPHAGHEQQAFGPRDAGVRSQAYRSGARRRDDVRPARVGQRGVRRIAGRCLTRTSQHRSAAGPQQRSTSVRMRCAAQGTRVSPTTGAGIAGGGARGAIAAAITPRRSGSPDGAGLFSGGDAAHQARTRSRSAGNRRGWAQLSADCAHGSRARCSNRAAGRVQPQAPRSRRRTRLPLLPRLGRDLALSPAFRRLPRA